MRRNAYADDATGAIVGFLIVSFVLVFILSAAAVFPKSLWTDRNVYSSAASLKVGDILIVKIEDVSQMKFSVTVADNNTFNITANPDQGITPFLPKVATDRKSASTGKTDFSGKNNMLVSIAARVTGRRDDGKFTVDGRRDYTFHGVRSSFRVRGIIDPALVKGKTVLADDIADFRMDIVGGKSGAPVDLKREPLKEGESAAFKLTEEEKQRIILDYVKKMLQEITR